MKMRRMNRKRRLLKICCLSVGNFLINATSVIRKRRKVWTKKWLQRKEHGANSALVKELSLEDPSGYLNFFRINAEGMEKMGQYACLVRIDLY